jgi:hypothetical protein
MPARSEAQRKYLYSRFGAEWVKAHGFDNAGKLPKRVSAVKKPKKAKPKPKKKPVKRKRY